VVFLALSRESTLEAIALANTGGHAVWVGPDTLSHDEHLAQVAKGVRVTRFTFELGVGADAIEDAVATIREHHPSETIWVQCTDSSR
jgi:hypothetical protein